MSTTAFAPSPTLVMILVKLAVLDLLRYNFGQKGVRFATARSRCAVEPPSGSAAGNLLLLARRVPFSPPARSGDRVPAPREQGLGGGCGQAGRTYTRCLGQGRSP